MEECVSAGHAVLAGGGTDKSGNCCVTAFALALTSFTLSLAIPKSKPLMLPPPTFENQLPIACFLRSNLAPVSALVRSAAARSEPPPTPRAKRTWRWIDGGLGIGIGEWRVVVGGMRLEIGRRGRWAKVGERVGVGVGKAQGNSLRRERAGVLTVGKDEVSLCNHI